MITRDELAKYYENVCSLPKPIAQYLTDQPAVFKCPYRKMLGRIFYELLMLREPEYLLYFKNSTLAEIMGISEQTSKMCLMALRKSGLVIKVDTNLYALSPDDIVSMDNQPVFMVFPESTRKALDVIKADYRHLDFYRDPNIEQEIKNLQDEYDHMSSYRFNLEPETDGVWTMRTMLKPFTKPELKTVSKLLQQHPHTRPIMEITKCLYHANGSWLGNKLKR